MVTFDSGETMETPSVPVSLVERKKYDEKTAHRIADGIWWVGFVDTDSRTSHNPFLVVDGTEAVLINPGPRASDRYRLVRDKVASVVSPKQIMHLVSLHYDPERCASLPLFEKIADRNVRLYAPSAIATSTTCYGCKHPVIGLDNGDSIIFRSGRSLEYHDTPGLPTTGTGFLFDGKTKTVFCGNIFGRLQGDWTLYAGQGQWTGLAPCESPTFGSKKAHLLALNKIERLLPERICPQCGPVIEDDIEAYLAAARKMDTGI